MRRSGVDVEDADSDCSMASCSSMDVVSQEEPEEMRVLAVDDNKIDRKLIEMLLKTSSFQVTAVSSAKAALEMLGLSGKGSSSGQGKDLDFDLIITDYCMPEMTGYDLLMRVKEDSSAWKDIPVVVMSSENRSSRINRCMAEGAQEFIIKPVQLTDVQRLKGHIRQARELRGNMSSSVSAKRKNSASSSLPAQGLERRARLSELTVA